MPNGAVVGRDPRTPQATGAGGRFERAPIRGARIRPGDNSPVSLRPNEACRAMIRLRLQDKVKRGGKFRHSTARVLAGRL